MDPTANRRETSATALTRVRRNDPALTKLEVSSIGFLRGRFVREGTGCYWPDDRADLARLGDAVGHNTQLRSLKIPNARNLADTAANNEAFFEGINRNASIRSLEMSYFDLTGGDELVVEWTSGERRQFSRNLDLSAMMGREFLNCFVAKNIHLTEIALDRCATLGNGGVGTLASAIKGCTNLNEIKLTNCNVDDDTMLQFVPGVGALQQLRTLDFSGENFGVSGCEALATLIGDPNCNLRHLYLCDNSRFDDECAGILADSLKVNNKLELLSLSGNNANGITNLLRMLRSCAHLISLCSFTATRERVPESRYIP